MTAVAVPPPLVLTVVGAGPRAAGLLERVVANQELAGGDVVRRGLRVHLVDAYPPGAGRVWRHDQSPLLRMNSMAADVTMFTDASFTGAGPVVVGPSLAEWARTADPSTLPDAATAAEVGALAPTDFPVRRVQHAYLSWFFSSTVESAPSWLTVTVHPDRVVEVRDRDDGRQDVLLAAADGPLVSDLVVLTVGHLDSADVGDPALLSAAAEHGLTYLPPGYTADQQLDDDRTLLPPGADVLVRGLGLAFVDLCVLVFQGRGGRYERAADGRLRYLASGAEPVLWAGSRRGVPHHAKTEYVLQAGRPPLPRFLDVDALLDRAAAAGPLDFRTDVWPALAKEVAGAWAHELFRGHPDRVALPWAEFDARFAPLAWDSAECRQLVADAVPDPADRLDLAALDAPLAGATFADRPDRERRLAGYVRADLARRRDARHSADLGVFLGLLTCYFAVGRLTAAGAVTPRSQVADVDGWWTGFFNSYASGPPGHRLEELLALVDAGLVHLLGPGVRFDLHDASFRARTTVPGEEVRARVLVEARLPGGLGVRGPDPLLPGLHAAGGATEEVLGGQLATGRLRTTPEGHVVLPEGAVHPRRFATGAFTSERAVAAFARPMTDSVSFRQSDALARALLRTL